MSDLFTSTSDTSLPLSSQQSDRELQQFLLVEKQKAQLNAQVAFKLE